MIKSIQISDEDFDWAVGLTKKVGYEYISLSFGSSKIFHEDNWEERIEEIKEKMDEHNLKCIQTHLPYYDLRISSEITDDKMEEAIKRCIKATAMLGAKWTAMHVRSSYDHNFSVSKAYEDNCRCIEDYLKIAQEVGAGIALENLPIFPACPCWRFYSSHYEDICAIVDKYAGDNMGICWDFGHAHLTHLDQKQALLYIGNRLKITHIHDNFERDDEHLLPTMGLADWKSFMPALTEINYNGPLTLEVNYKNNSATEAFFNFGLRSLEYLEELM